MTEDVIIDVPSASRLQYIGFHNDLGTRRTQEYKRRLKQWADSKPAAATWISPRSKETVVNCCRGARGESWPRRGCIKADDNWIPDRLANLDEDVQTLRDLAGCVLKLLRDTDQTVLCVDGVGLKKAPAVVCAFLLIHTDVSSLAAAWMSVRHRGCLSRELLCLRAGHTDGQPHEDVPKGSGTRPNPLSMALEKICMKQGKSLVGSPVFMPAPGTKRPRSPDQPAASTSQADSFSGYDTERDEKPSQLC